MNILVLDDEKEIADLVEVYLKNENYNVYKFYDSNKAIECINNQKLDFAILDVMIKDVDGFKICKMIRDKGFNFPIIMQRRNRLIFRNLRKIPVRISRKRHEHKNI